MILSNLDAPKPLIYHLLSPKLLQPLPILPAQTTRVTPSPIPLIQKHWQRGPALGGNRVLVLQSCIGTQQNGMATRRRAPGETTRSATATRLARCHLWRKIASPSMPAGIAYMKSVKSERRRVLISLKLGVSSIAAPHLVLPSNALRPVGDELRV